MGQLQKCMHGLEVCDGKIEIMHTKYRRWEIMSMEEDAWPLLGARIWSPGDRQHCQAWKKQNLIREHRIRKILCHLLFPSFFTF